VVDYLRLFSRSYMFSASLPAPQIAAILAGIELLRAEPERVQRLRDNVAYMVAGLRSAGFDVSAQTAIIPIFVPATVSPHVIARRLHDEGLFVNAVEWPAVPRDRQRLRLSMMATFERADLDYAVDVLARVGRQMGFLPEPKLPGATDADTARAKP
jgi:7-keto-8-aminopelargonate synthetase-like enzyme